MEIGSGLQPQFVVSHGVVIAEKTGMIRERKGNLIWWPRTSVKKEE